jgi:hypothetical protein
MAGRWLAARSLFAPAIALALVLGVSCVLPSYSVGQAGSGNGGGGSTSTAHASGGAGASDATTSSGSGVGPGGGGIGGTGIGGDVSCGGNAKNGLTVATVGNPHDLTVSPKYVYWIADPTDTVYVALQGTAAPATLSITDACGISGGQIGGIDQVVIRQNTGAILVATAPTFVPMSVFGATTPPDGPGACAISEDQKDSDFFYGFEKSADVYSLVEYQISVATRAPMITLLRAPVAIDATNDIEVAWLEAASGSGAFVTAFKANAKEDANLPGGPAFNHLCAYGQEGTFAFTQTSPGAIDTWSINGPQGFLTNTAADRSGIACTATRHVWIDDDGSCGTIQSKDTKLSAVDTIATYQPRACSIAVSGPNVYWANCEPSGGVFMAKLP